MKHCAECRRLEDQALEAVLQFVSLVQRGEFAERNANGEEIREVQPLIVAARERRSDAAQAFWRHSREHGNRAEAPLRVVSRARTLAAGA